MKRKTKLFFLFLLFSLLVFFVMPNSLIPTTKAAGKTWRVPQDYPNLDSAIIVSTTGDSIQVSAGSYSGFTVDKMLTITGSGTGTLITGKVTINANAVVLTKLKITGMVAAMGNNIKIINNEIATSGQDAIFTDQGSTNSGNNFEVTDNVITGTGGSIRVNDNNKILRNSVTSVGGALWAGSGNVISENSVPQMGVGSDTVVSNNTIFGPLSMYESSGDSVSNNTITGTVTCGYNGIISDNVITCTTGNGLDLGRSGVLGSNNQLQRNFITSSGIGIIGHGGANNNLSNNTINAGGTGIYLEDQADLVYRNIIKSNSNGIQDRGAYPPGSKIDENTITADNIGISSVPGAKEIIGNDITAIVTGISVYGCPLVTGNTIRNSQTGIISSGSAKSNLFYNNNLVNNVKNANDDVGAAWDNGNRGNFWSDWTTPDDNNDGIVDKPYVVPGTSRAVDRYPLTTLFAYAPTPSPTPTPTATPNPTPTPSPTVTSLPTATPTATTNPTSSPTSPPNIYPSTSPSPTPAVPEFPAAITTLTTFAATILAAIFLHKKRRD